jgi:hypothetical protein
VRADIRIVTFEACSDHGVYQTGAPEEIRTPDPQIRSLVLYPAELRARFAWAFRAQQPRRIQ